jgi:hypothetical protein
VRAFEDLKQQRGPGCDPEAARWTPHWTDKMKNTQKPF